MRRLSRTHIRAWKACPPRCKQIYILGRKELPGPPLTLGSAVNAGLETLHRNRTAAPASLEDVPMISILASTDRAGDRSAWRLIPAVLRLDLPVSEGETEKGGGPT